MIHVSKENPKGPNPTKIGSNVQIGEKCVIHACTVEDGAVIEGGVIIYDFATIGKGARILAGSFVSQGKHVNDGEVGTLTLENFYIFTDRFPCNGKKDLGWSTCKACGKCFTC